MTGLLALWLPILLSSVSLRRAWLDHHASPGDTRVTTKLTTKTRRQQDRKPQRQQSCHDDLPHSIRFFTTAASALHLRLITGPLGITVQLRRQRRQRIPALLSRQPLARASAVRAAATLSGAKLLERASCQVGARHYDARGPHQLGCSWTFK